MKRDKRPTNGIRAAAAVTLLTAGALLATAALVVAPALGASGAASGAAPYAIKPATGLIAFVRDTTTSPATVWVASPTGSHARELGPGELPAASPDGAIVAVARSAGGAVLLYSSSGKLLHKFVTATGTPSPGNGLTPFAWSPDSRYLAVQVASTALNGVTGAGLAVIDTTAGTYKLIAKGIIDGASFAVDGTDRIVYGAAPTLSDSAPANLFTINPDGSARTQISSDGRSLDPIWGAGGIAFDRERLRGPDAAPAYQVWLLSGTRTRQLTNMSIPVLVDGLVPIAFSASGNRMIAEYEGEDTNFAWTIQLSPLRVRQVPGLVQGGGISRSGNSLLIDRGAFEQPDSDGTVESVPFSGTGAVHKLTRGGLPSWNL